VPDDGNGKQQQINGLKAEDRVMNTKLDLITQQIKDVQDILDEAFGSKGFCHQHQIELVEVKKKTEANKDWIRAIWAIVIALGVVAIKAAFF